jgi:hypothetical protein
MRTTSNSSVIIPLPQIESIQPVNNGKDFIIRCISKQGSFYDWKFDNRADRDAEFSILASLLGLDFKVKKLKTM